MLGFFRRIVGKELSPEEQAKKRSEAIAAGAGNGALTTCVHFLVWDGDSEDAAHASVERLLKSASAAGLVRSSSGGAGHDGVIVDDFDGVSRRVPSIVRLGQSDANALTFAPDGSCYNVTGGTSSHRSEHHGTGDDQFLSASAVAAFADVYARVNCLPSGDGVADGASATRGTGGAWRVPNEGTHPWLTSYSSAGTAPPVQFISAVSAEGIAIECASRLSDEFMAHAPILVVPEVGSTEEDYVLRRVAAYRREFGAENGDNDERVYSDAEGESPSRAHQPKRFLGEGGVEEEIVDAQEEGPHVDAQRRAAAAARRGKGLESIDRVSFREQLLASEYMQCACDMDPVRRTIFRAAANDWDDELVTTAEFSVAFQKSISVQHAALCDMKAQEGNLAERALAKKRAARQGGDLDSNVAPGRFDDALSARTVGPNATLSADAKKKALLDAKKFGEIASQISCGVSVLSHMIVVVPAAQFRRIYEQVLDPRFSEEAHYVLAEAEQRMHFCPGSVTQLHLAPSVAHTVQAQLAHEARRHAAATGAGADDATAAGNGPQSARPISAWGADSSSLTGGALPPPSARTTNEANFIASTPSVEVTFDPQGAASAARAFVGENSGSSAVGGAITTDYTTVGSTTLSSSAAGASHTAGSAYNTSQGAGAAGARSSAVGVGNGGYGQGENFERTRAAVGVAGGWTLQARWSGAAATPLLSDLAAATSGGGGGAAIFAAMLPHLNVAARVGVPLHPHPATFYEAIRPTWVRQLAAAAQTRAGGATGMAVDMGGSAAAAAAGPASPLSSLGLLTSPGETAPLVGARNPFASPQLTAHALVAAGGEMMPPMTARNPVQALSQYVDQAIAPPAFAPGIDKKQQAIQLEAHRDRLRAHLERLLDVLSTAGEAPFFLSCTRRDEICRLRTPATIETLLLILYNLDQRPTEQRFRILACGSERFYETLGKYPAAMAVLGGVGFSRFNATARVLVLSEAEAAAWAVERRRCIAVLEALYEARRIQHYLNPPPPPRNVDDLMY